MDFNRAQEGRKLRTAGMRLAQTVCLAASLLAFSGFAQAQDAAAFVARNGVRVQAADATQDTWHVVPTVQQGHVGKEMPQDHSQFAQSVGAPTRYTCGQCHFYGGGGDGVKHGDMDSSLVNPSRAEDVHMDAKGLNFSCQECHSC